MMKRTNKIQFLKSIPLLFILVLSVACNKDDGGSGNSDELDASEVATIMNNNLELPSGAFIFDEDSLEVDNSIEITSNTGITMPLYPGTQMNNSISFTAPNGNVSAVGMRFGLTGPISFVPISAGGATSGSGSFDFVLNPEICSNLSSICHNIKCYEFALTVEGRISAANIQEVAMMCGNCEEPSCQGLIDPEDCQEEPEGEGNPGFYLKWDNANNDLDLEVVQGEDLTGINEDLINSKLDCDGDGICSEEYVVVTSDVFPSGWLFTIFIYNYESSPISFELSIYDNNELVQEYNETIQANGEYTITYTH